MCVANHSIPSVIYTEINTIKFQSLLSTIPKQHTNRVQITNTTIRKIEKKMKKNVWMF